MMTRIGHNLLRTPVWVLSAMFLLIPMGYVGCSFAGAQILPASLESRVSSSTGTADDHLAAALLYQKEAQRAQAEGNKYAQAAASIRPIEDPKGFRRNALMRAAQENQKYAGEMQQLYATHQTKAETMLGKQQPQ